MVKGQGKRGSMKSEMCNSVLSPLREKMHSTTVYWENQPLHALYVTKSFYEHKSLSETLWTRYKAESCLPLAHMEEKLRDSEMHKSMGQVSRNLLMRPM